MITVEKVMAKDVGTCMACTNQRDEDGRIYAGAQIILIHPNAPFSPKLRLCRVCADLLQLELSWKVWAK